MGLKSPSSYMTQLEVWVTFNLTCASVQWHCCIFPLTLDGISLMDVSVAQFLQIILILCFCRQDMCLSDCR